MKVELLVNLKLGDGRMISTGTVYSDKDAPIPEFIMRRVAKRQAKIIEQDRSAPTLAPAPKVEAAKVNKVAEVKTETPVVPKAEKKKGIKR